MINSCMCDTQPTIEEADRGQRILIVDDELPIRTSPDGGESTSMEKCINALFLGFYVAALTLAPVQQVWATLGESVESVSSDRKVLSAVQHAATTRNGYTVQALESDANSVREYVSSSGVVFAVAWNGLSHPDLSPLLGSYAGEYRHALQQTPRKPGHRSLQVKTARVVVERWGHMRNLQGRAYVPALIPPGVSVDEIK